VAVISLGDIVCARSLRVAGDTFDEAIVQYIRRKYNVLIGERTAEEIKFSIGSAAGYEGEGALDIRGRNLIDGLPKNVEVTSADVREALEDPLQQIVETVRLTLEKTPPELAADIMDGGIVLTGGSAQLRGLGKRLGEKTGMPVRVAEAPADCAVTGIAICLEKDTLNVGKAKR
jgi:rod shape-determining protein MreB